MQKLPEMNRKIRVLIPDAESGHALITARALAETKKIDLFVMARDPKAALRYSFRKKSFKAIDTDKDNMLNINSLLKEVDEKKIDLVLPIDEDAHKVISRNLELVHSKVKTSPIAPNDVYEAATNKWKLAKLCEENKIPYPKSVYVEGTAFSDNIIEKMYFPILIKPESGHGGLNIKIIKSKDELKNFFKSNPDLSMGNYLLQEYVKGYDIDMSLLAKDGKIIAFTIQKGFIKRANVFAASAGIKFLYNEKLYNIIDRLIKELNFSGIAHLDLRYDEDQDEFKVIEINARYWGSLTGSVQAGVNFPYLACLVGMGIKIELPQYKYCRHIDYSTALKTMIKYPFVRGDNRIKYKETDIKYILSDPIAEFVNIMRRRANR